MPRIHILGASGSGTSTLGAALATQLGIPHADADTFFWFPTDPPFSTPRPKPERVSLLQSALPSDADWVFSGSAINWATPLEPYYDIVVYLRLDHAIRMARLRRRETERYGNRIEPGGDMASASAAFLAWASAYDTAGLEQRSQAAHEAWLKSRICPVLRLDSSSPVKDLLATLLHRTYQL